ncbi:MAG TPA: trypsin-like peptidase domain-containing protein [Gemmatales bacterium]|nr:trypsin-like peptidase domain-containing protein [Gemmatales bacterium]
MNLRRLLPYILVGIFSSCITCAWLQGSSWLSPVQAQATNDLLDLSPEEQNSVRIYQEANKAVVNITTRSMQQDDFFMMNMPREGSGSGAVIDKLGHIVTNFHVVEEARQIVVNLFDGNSYRAELVGADPNNDLAVLRVKVPEEKLFPLKWGDSSKLLVGMRVFALGNPFGLERTLTVGIVSSLNRTLKTDTRRTIRGIIQTDAVINPGNSGGPLLNRKGEIIGINTAIVTRSGQSAGIGLAVPSNTAQRIVADLINYGRVQRADIGIHAVWETDRGLLIALLNPNGAAAEAGLRGPQEITERRNGIVYRGVDRSKADFILAVDGKRVKTLDELLSYIETKQAGEQVVLTIVREGKRVEVPITLEWGK